MVSQCIYGSFNGRTVCELQWLASVFMVVSMVGLYVSSSG